MIYVCPKYRSSRAGYIVSTPRPRGGTKRGTGVILPLPHDLSFFAVRWWYPYPIRISLLQFFSLRKEGNVLESPPPPPPPPPRWATSGLAQHRGISPPQTKHHGFPPLPMQTNRSYHVATPHYLSFHARMRWNRYIEVKVGVPLMRFHHILISEWIWFSCRGRIQDFQMGGGGGGNRLCARSAHHEH